MTVRPAHRRPLWQEAPIPGWLKILAGVAFALLALFALISAYEVGITLGAWARF